MRHCTANAIDVLAGKSSTLAPPGNNKLPIVVGQVAGVGVPVPVQLSTTQLVKPAPGVSVTTDPVPLAGPELVNVTVYKLVPPATVVVMPSVLNTLRFAAGATVLVTVMALLAVDESKVVPVKLADTELVTVPVAVDNKGAVITN